MQLVQALEGQQTQGRSQAIETARQVEDEIRAAGGEIVAVTSAAPLRGIPGVAAYCAARGAQNAFVRAAGLELAPAGVQLNAIAQNYVRNEAYYPDDLVATERFQTHLARNVPRGRLAEPHETADLAVFLASPRSDFIVAQVIPFAGGWTIDLVETGVDGSGSIVVDPLGRVHVAFDDGVSARVASSP